MEGDIVKNIINLSRELKKRDNQYKIGIVTGKVIGVSPVKVEISNLDIQATQGRNLILSEGLSLQYNDEVIIQASENNKTFYLLSRAVR